MWWASSNQAKDLSGGGKKTEVPQGRGNSDPRQPLASSCNISSYLSLLVCFADFVPANPYSSSLFSSVSLSPHTHSIGSVSLENTDEYRHSIAKV